MKIIHIAAVCLIFAVTGCGKPRTAVTLESVKEAAEDVVSERADAQSSNAAEAAEYAHALAALNAAKASANADGWTTREIATAETKGIDLGEAVQAFIDKGKIDEDAIARELRDLRSKNALLDAKAETAGALRAGENAKRIRGE